MLIISLIHIVFCTRQDILGQFSMVNLELFNIVEDIKKVSKAFVVYPKNVTAENATSTSVSITSRVISSVCFLFLGNFRAFVKLVIANTLVTRHYKEDSKQSHRSTLCAKQSFHCSSACHVVNKTITRNGNGRELQKRAIVTWHAKPTSGRTN